jgi:hypothetical protein
MKRPYPQNEKPRFSGHLRHYHRSNYQTQRSWEEWVDGKASRPWITQKSIKITLIILTALALAGIIAGLVIELR